LTSSNELSSATAFYTSALPRAIQTGEILSAALPKTLEAVVDAALNEISVGEGDGLPWPSTSSATVHRTGTSIPRP